MSGRPAPLLPRLSVLRLAPPEAAHPPVPGGGGGGGRGGATDRGRVLHHREQGQHGAALLH